MKPKSGFLTSEFVALVIVILLPIFFDMEIEETAVAGLVAAVYAIGRTILKKTAVEGEVVIELEGAVISIDYDDEALLRLGRLARGWWSNNAMQDDAAWVELARAILHYIKADLGSPAK